MTQLRLAWRSLLYFWRTHLAVVLGVSVAVSVLAGALLVGESVRASLRQLALERLGRTGTAIVATTDVREALARDVTGQPGVGGPAAPLIALEGAVAHDMSGRRAARIQVLGVDDRFWRFHGLDSIPGPGGRAAFISPALAAELGAAEGDALVVRVRQPAEIPASTLQGRRDQAGRALRTSIRSVLPAGQLGEFSLVPQQGPVRALFVPLERLQRDLDLEGRVNTVLLRQEDAASVERALAAAVASEDLGFHVRQIENRHALSLESPTGLVNDRLRAVAAAEGAKLGFAPLPVLTYMANRIRVGDREVPYSAMAALDLAAYAAAGGASASAGPSDGDPAPVWLNTWTANELGARVGDPAEVEYFVWSDEAGLTTARAAFTVAGIVPMDGAGGDPSLTPEYPGITDAGRIGDWDPPFPVDLSRIRPADERYWDEYRAAPKAFVPLATGERIWHSQFGTATSIRFQVPAEIPLGVARDRLVARLRAGYSPAAAGIAVHPVRARARAAAQGSTDFGEYFSYFSFFLVVSGLLLTGLFFRLGIEGRARQIGLLYACGFPRRAVRRVLMLEGGLLAIAGSVAGAAGAVGFAGLILYGLRTWWVDAVGTTRLALVVTPGPLAAGVAAGIAMAFAAMWWTLRGISTAGSRTLLAGGLPGSGAAVRRGQARRARLAAAVLAMLASVLVLAAYAGAVPPAAGFFGGGACLLGALLAGFSAWLRRDAPSALQGTGTAGLMRLGAGQTAWRPGRSVLSAALIAAATFLIVSVGAFRRDASPDLTARTSSGGGFTLIAESVVPLMHDPGDPEGRRELGLDGDQLPGLEVARFRLLPGDEGSCLNLYRPVAPRIIAPTDEFRRESRFRFASSLASSDAERANPWLLLDRRFDDGAIPVIGDANSLTYALHRKVGEDFQVPGPGGVPVTLRVVAALADSVFQSELIISERDFIGLFPRHEGYRVFLLHTPGTPDGTMAAELEEGLSDYGFDVQSVAARMAAYHRVENTYLSTFQALGALGLVLGTLGLGTVLLRNVLERQRELALLRAVGYRERHLSVLVIAESLLLLGVGVLGGIAAALVAIAPALDPAAAGARSPLTATAWLLAAVLAAGLVSTWWAARTAARLPLLQALRSE